MLLTDNSDIKIALPLAIKNNYVETVLRLLEMQAISSSIHCPYEYATRIQNQNLSEQIIILAATYIDINQTDEYDLRPLDYAFRSGRPRIVELFLKNGAEPRLTPRIAIKFHYQMMQNIKNMDIQMMGDVLFRYNVQSSFEQERLMTNQKRSESEKELESLNQSDFDGTRIHFHMLMWEKKSYPILRWLLFCTDNIEGHIKSLIEPETILRNAIELKDTEMIAFLETRNVKTQVNDTNALDGQDEQSEPIKT
jgi:hypothetical protein